MSRGSFEEELNANDIDTFSYIFVVRNKRIVIKEVYAFLTSNQDNDGYLPAYLQMKPTVEKNIQEIEIRNYKGGQKLLCFVVVGMDNGSAVPADPKSWDIRFRRK